MRKYKISVQFYIQGSKNESQQWRDFTVPPAKCGDLLLLCSHDVEKKHGFINELDDSEGSTVRQCIRQIQYAVTNYTIVNGTYACFKLQKK